MRHFNDLSIRHKLTAIILFTSFVVLLLASILFVTSEVLTVRRIIMQELSALAQIVGSNSSAAMLFDDRHTAQENLAALRAKPNIESAHVFLSDGTLFARFVRTPTTDGRHLMLEPDPMAAVGRVSANMQLWAGVMTLNAPIFFDNELIGSISIRSNLDQMYSLLNAFLGFAILVLALSLATAWVMSQRLQRIISQPVLQLLDAMQQVTRSKDYSVRAPKRRDDELGYVIDGFNAMLAQVQANHENLRSAWREASAASRAKSEFLANMSHELRTPLNAILGFSEVISSERLGGLGNPVYRDYARDIYDSGSHLLEVISDILDISKVEAGELQPETSEVNVATIIRKSVRLVKGRANAAGLDVVINVEPGLPRLVADERLIKQCLINLLSNAVKFTPTGGSVTVTATRDPKGGLAIRVSDTGIGIPAKDIGRVFLPFSQVESAFSRKYAGTGLGLPLARSFAEAHGGTLTLASTRGQGTVATLWLPEERFASASEPAAGNAATEPAASKVA